jgi:hypothetical protein
MTVTAEDYDYLRGDKLDTYDFKNCRTRDKTGPYWWPDVVAAIRVTQGNLTKIATLLGRTRNSVKSTIWFNPVLKEIFDEVREGILDHVEENVFMSAVEGDGANQRFLLQTIGKNRGYATRVEQTGENGGPIRSEVTAKIDASKLSPEQRDALRELLAAAKEG